MLKSETVRVDGKELLGVMVNLPGAPVLMLVGQKGFLGCGYFRTDVADRVGHALATVSGVSSFDDMLAAKVNGVSAKAAELGIEQGMAGRKAAALLA